jgi:dihydrofolate reductase
MRKLFSFMVTTLDGYHTGPNGEFDWPNVDEEFNEFSIRQINDIDTLLFGRVTYEYMAQFWPSPDALEADPVTAERMNSVHKLVFSATLKEPSTSTARRVRPRWDRARASIAATSSPPSTIW